MKILFAIIVFIVARNALGSGQPPKGKQSWGYVDVRPGAHMFWWLYYADVPGDGYLARPLVLWLNGGPGASSTGYGNFAELGPVTIDGIHRNETWVKEVNLLFVDNPVGSGFSYVDDNKTSLLCTNNSQVAADLTAFTITFLSKLPEFSSIPFYIFAESYGGKMAVEYARSLYKLIVSGKVKASLKGVALGDPWISPMDSIMSWAPYLLETGVIDTVGSRNVEKYANITKAAILAGNWTEALKMWSKTEDVVTEYSSNVDFYNILKPTKPRSSISVKTHGYIGALYYRHVVSSEDQALSAFMNGVIKTSLRVIPQNVSWGSMRHAVFDALSNDFMKSVTHIVETLLNSTQVSVTVYSGQLDLIVATPGTLSWVEKLNWAGSKRWIEAVRSPLIVSGYTQGYSKSLKKFSFYWINRAGHMVPKDNPSAALALLKAVTMLK